MKKVNIQEKPSIFINVIVMKNKLLLLMLENLDHNYLVNYILVDLKYFIINLLDYTNTIRNW